MKMRTRKFLPRRLAILALALTGVASILTRREVPNVWARTNGERKPILIHKPIDEGRRIRFRGNTRPEANERNDRGRVEDSLPLEHMLLQLKRAPELEQQFDEYIEGLTDKNSPNFRQ